MRALDEYGLLEWASFTPLVHGFKRVRNIALERTFRRARPHALDQFLADHGQLSGGTIAVAIAYNTPWVIDLLMRMAKRNLAAGTLIVADNSRKREARTEIKRLCRESGTPYIGLPFNPVLHPCRSHGVAINWVYYNVVRPLRPKVFAFLDHDLFPLDRLDLAALVRNQPVYGELKQSPWGWNLWAGYCVYDFVAVERYPLDFNNDLPRKLDTGGQNFMALYRHLDRDALRFTYLHREQITDPLDGSERSVDFIDDCMHIGSLTRPIAIGRPAKYAPTFYQRIVQACEAGAKLGDLWPRRRVAGDAPRHTRAFREDAGRKAGETIR